MKGTIIIIGEDKTYCSKIVSSLTNNFYKTLVFASGKEGVEYLKNPETLPDLILINDFLPDADSVEVIRYFINKGFDYAFVILVDSASKDIAIDAMKSGAQDYRIKSNLKLELFEISIENNINLHRQKKERDELEKKLKESELAYKSITENSDDIIMRFDKDFKHLYVNPVTTKYLGIDYHEFIGKTHHELGFIKEEYEYWEQQISKVFETGKALNQVAPVNNETIWFDWNLIPEINEDGEITSVLSYSRNISDIMNAKKAIELNEKRLKELNVTKDRLFSIIGHDLRGPIGSFKSLLELMLTDFDLTNTDEVKEILQMAVTSANSTYYLLENLLTWAKSQQNEIVFKQTKENLFDVCEKVIALLSEIAHSKKITIHNTIDKDLLVFVDYNMLSTILRNLISNAIKFTHKGKNIYINSFIDDSKVTIEVKDEGVGIEKETIEKLFKPSENVVTYGTSGEKGSGLGLLLCKEFVEKHEGKIWVESEIGKGSSFTFSLPL